MDIAIDLWIWPLAGGAAALAAAQDLLSRDEAERAARFVRAPDRDSFILARAGLRTRLAGYLGQTPGEIRFDTVARGKPVVRDGPAFNLSHSAGIAALAVAPARSATGLRLGVDIEAHRPVEPGVADLSFSPTERAELEAVPAEDWLPAFFRGWTRKEAVIKATGAGLYANLQGFSVTLSRDGDARVLDCTSDMGRPADWFLAGFELGPDLPGAIAAETGGAGLDVSLREAPNSAKPVFCF